MIRRIFNYLLGFLVGFIIPFSLFYFVLWDRLLEFWFWSSSYLNWLVLLFSPVISLPLIMAPSRFSSDTISFFRRVIAIHALIILLLAFIGWGGAVSIITFLVDLILWGLISNKGLIHFRKAVLWSVTVFISSMIIWPILNVGIVIWRAETIAKGHPYCIQVASHNIYKVYEAPKSLIDLSSLKMRGSKICGNTGHCSYFQHHAVLIVDNPYRGYFNWSYWKQNFVSEVVNRDYGYFPSMRCNPEPHFALHLPFIFENRPTIQCTGRLDSRR